MMEAAPLLRGSLDHDAPRQDTSRQDAPPLDDRTHSDADHHDADALDEQPAPRRTGRVAFTISILVVIGAVGAGAAIWVVKGAPGLPRTPPLIMAADGPTKVQPPTQDTIASPNDSASALLKDQAAKPGPVTIVSNVEQPVDLQQQTKAQPAPAPTPAPAAPANASASAPTPAPAAPADQAQTRGVAVATVGSIAAPPAAPSLFPEPKRVKTVSVRPDGTVISTGSELAAAPATMTADASASAAPLNPLAPPNPPARPTTDAADNAAPLAATPKLDLPAKPSAKSTARVPVAKLDSTVAGAANRSPEAPLQITPGAADKPAKVARPAAPAPQVATADSAAPTTTATTTTGGYAVQLAAPPSEREAQSVSTRLQAKYAAELGGLQPTIRQADSNGKAIYRVRYTGMAKADAVSLCQKLKAAGGDCFVAKD